MLTIFNNGEQIGARKMHLKPKKVYNLERNRSASTLVTAISSKMLYDLVIVKLG